MTPRHSMTDLLALGILPPSKWRFLRHLSLAENGLTSLSAESLRPVAGTLQSLDLSGNLFKEVPDGLSSLTNLRALNLCNNMIDSLRSLTKDPLPAVTTLNMRSNRLSSLVGIEKILTLERVDLRDNRLRDPAELRRLTIAMELVDVYVIKNPFTRSHGNYRVEIFNAFRDTPGHPAGITIDATGPTSSEKKQLHDKAPEQAPVTVVQPVPEEDEEDVLPGAEDELVELESSAFQSQESEVERRGHRRATSDVGPVVQRRKKRGPRRRIVELSQQEALGTSPREPSLLHTAEMPPQTPTDIDEPTTPGQTPYHTAPTTQTRPEHVPQRPTINTTFTTTTPAPPSPRIRDSSDDDDSPGQSPEGLDSNTDLYRQKIEALKQEFGPNWLAAFHENRSAEQRQRERSFSPASRTAQQARGVSVGVGGRRLG